MKPLIPITPKHNYGETWELEVYMVVLDGIKSVQEHRPIYAVAKEVRPEDIIEKGPTNANE